MFLFCIHKPIQDEGYHLPFLGRFYHPWYALDFWADVLHILHLGWYNGTLWNATYTAIVWMVATVPRDSTFPILRRIISSILQWFVCSEHFNWSFKEVSIFSERLNCTFIYKFVRNFFCQQHFSIETMMFDKVAVNNLISYLINIKL